MVSSLEVDIMLKYQEGRLHDAIQDVDRNNEKRMKNQLSMFASDLKDLKDVAKERHILFIQDVKKVREDVNIKIQEPQEDMCKEIDLVQQDYASSNQKIDIIADAVTEFVKLYEVLGLKVEQMSKDEVHSISEINKLTESKELVLKSGSYSLITREFLSLKFRLFETVIQK